MPLLIEPASKRFKAEFLRTRATVPEDVSLGELLDRIMEHGIFLELSSRIRLLSFPLRGAQERLIIDWNYTEVSPRRLPG